MTKILVIEDEKPVRENIVETLMYSGYEVQGAFNGDVGLRLAKELQPDIVICDIMMDGLDGYGVLKALRQDAETASLPVIFLTARADRMSMRYGMELGADDYITKPFSTTELLDAIRSRLKRMEMITSDSEQRMLQVRNSLMELIANRIQYPLESVNVLLEAITRRLRLLSPADVLELLDVATGDNRRARRLVGQLSWLMRLDTDMLTHASVTNEGKRTVLSEVWRAALKEVQTDMADKERVEFVVDEHHPQATTICDREALTQVFYELLDNAAKFSPDGAHIQVTQWIDGASVWFSITDYGPGMSPRQINAALGLNEDTADGLGLKLARRILDAHGGGLALHGGPNEGTTAALWLPVVKPF